jgi:hypothetical protein
MRVAVVGAGVAGLTAAAALKSDGHQVTVLDKGRRPGGRLATRELGGGARADHGAQFFTVRHQAFADLVAGWVAEGTVWEWCRGFGADDGHPRYAALGGMAALAAHMAAGLDVHQSAKVGVLRRQDGRWLVGWGERADGAGAAVEQSSSFDSVVLTAPVPQSAALLQGQASPPELAYTPTLSLLVSLDGPPAVPSPGAAQLGDDPVWSWVADNMAKRVSVLPALTLHTTAELASARWSEPDEVLVADLLVAARPWMGRSQAISAALHRWRYATPVEPYGDRCWSAPGGGLVVAGDAFAGPRVEGAFLSGRAAALAVRRREPRDGGDAIDYG